MKGSITKDYSAYKITTGSSTQDLALVFGEGVTDEKYVDFSVEWVKMAKIEIVKKDAGSNAKVAGAVYGIYSDEAGKNLIAKMPATDANGASSITIEKTQNTVYLKEISVPNGYVLDTKSYGINLVIGGTTKKDVTDKEQFADLTVYKEGEVLTGASVTDSTDAGGRYHPIRELLGDLARPVPFRSTKDHGDRRFLAGIYRAGRCRATGKPVATPSGCTCGRTAGQCACRLARGL